MIRRMPPPLDRVPFLPDMGFFRSDPPVDGPVSRGQLDAAVGDLHDASARGQGQRTRLQQCHLRRPNLCRRVAASCGSI